jgi:hypothetical protein
MACDPSAAPRLPAAQPKAEPVSERWEEWIQPWTQCADFDGACREWVSRVTAANEAAVFAVRDRYLASDQVSRGVVMEPKRFLQQQADCGWRGKWPAKVRDPEEVAEEARAAGRLRNDKIIEQEEKEKEDAKRNRRKAGSGAPAEPSRVPQIG